MRSYSEHAITRSLLVYPLCLDITHYAFGTHEGRLRVSTWLLGIGANLGRGIAGADEAAFLTVFWLYMRSRHRMR